MELFEATIDWLLNLIWNTPEALPAMVIILLAYGIFITFRLGFIQFRQFKHGVKVILGTYDDPDDEGDLNHFQALSTALSATVGIGNIAGVALGVHFGGPGALFWMWITAIPGMVIKYSEVTLAQNTGLQMRMVLFRVARCITLKKVSAPIGSGWPSHSQYLLPSAHF